MPLSAQAITLDVRFKLTDLEYRPIAAEKVRVVFGSDSGWKTQGSGRAFTTDAKGEAHFTAQANLDRRWRQPSGPLPPSLPKMPQATDHLMAAAELEYAGHRWLYAVDLCRFSNGAVMQDGFEVFTQDPKGEFSRKAAHDGRGWGMADLGGFFLSAPGHEPWEFMMEPLDLTSSPQRWRLNLAFKRAPDPLRR